MRKRFGVLGAGCLLALLAAPVPARAADEVFERSLPLRTTGSFTLSNINGSVHLEVWNREEVYLRAEKDAKGSSARSAQVQIEVQATPDAVSVATRYPEDTGLDVTVEYRVRVPARLRQVRMETVNGSLRLRGLEAAGILRTVNGNIELLDGAGPISARATNGNVRLDLAHLDAPHDARDPVTVETVNGSVVLKLPAGADATLEVRSLNGDFHSQLPVAIESSGRSGEVRARLGRGGRSMRVRTVNGGIRVVTAPSAI